MSHYKISYTQRNGERVSNQIFTADKVSDYLVWLDKWGCYDVVAEQVKE